MSYPTLKIPDVITTPKRTVEIPFNAVVPLRVGALNGRVTLVSSLIPYPFRVLRIKMVFDEVALNNLFYRWFISTNAQTSATSPPAGDDLTATESPTPYFIGNNLIITANINQDFPSDRHYLKMYCENANLYAVQANATVILQEL
jgi:hypothetical protein